MQFEKASNSALHKDFLSRREAIHAQFERDGDADVVLRDTTKLVDEVISALPSDKAMRGVAIVAIGGYGRGELFPYSDIDLLFLHCEKKPARVKPFADSVLYPLWDLDLTVGHAVRTLDETVTLAKGDITILTSLLDARLVAGDAELYASFEKRFSEEVQSQNVQGFVEAKLEERDRRHKKTGDSRYLLEPNVKDGKGGLRDLHTLYWLARYCYPIRQVSELVELGALTPEEYDAFAAAQQFLSKVRVHLHYLAGRAEEHLTFDRQPQVAEKFGFTGKTPNHAVERFMKRYFLTAKIVGALTRIFCANLEEEKKRMPRLTLARREETESLAPFVLDGERLNIPSEDFFQEDPVQLIALFALAHREGIDIHPYALREVTRNLKRIDHAMRADAHANTLFMDIFLSKRNPAPTLRRMHDAGVLARFIPDFGLLTGQMQFDRYHIYTVDEHTLNAIGILHQIEAGELVETLPVASDIIHKLSSRRVLYLALLSHDMAKGRGGDHSALGGKIAFRLAQRFGFAPLECETCEWLVESHLLFSHVAFKRDLNDPKTIEDFVREVQSPERLKLLLVLTAADIRAVGPQVWNGWKGALMRELYAKAMTAMGSDEAPGREEMYDILKVQLREKLFGWNDEEIDAYLALGSPSFIGDHDAATHAIIARLLREQQLTEDPVLTQAGTEEFHAITQLVLVARDQQGMFSKITGALSLMNANIVSCKIATLKNGMAVEVFGLQNEQGLPWEYASKLKRFTVLATQALLGKTSIEEEMEKRKPSYPSRMGAFNVPVGVFIDNTASAQFTVIEVDGQDRLGFLYDVTRLLSTLRLNIATAHISTYGVRAVDVFYVKDTFGMKITHEEKCKQIREAMLAALADGGRKAAG